MIRLGLGFLIWGSIVWVGLVWGLRFGVALLDLERLILVIIIWISFKIILCP